MAPKTFKRGAVRKVASVPLAGGLAREIRTKANMAIWRVDKETAQACLKAIAVDEVDAQPNAGGDEAPAEKAPAATGAIPPHVETAASRVRGPAKFAATAAMANTANAPASAAVATAPGDGTKIACA